MMIKTCKVIAGQVFFVVFLALFLCFYDLKELYENEKR